MNDHLAKAQKELVEVERVQIVHVEQEDLLDRPRR
jgi:hypothetical protein